MQEKPQNIHITILLHSPEADNILLTFYRFECMLYVDIRKQKECLAWSSF